jgi:hypothetical protein
MIERELLDWLKVVDCYKVKIITVDVPEFEGVYVLS